jgi:hypothetical protein
VEVPESQLNNVAFETTGSTTTVTTEATVTEMEITVEKNVVVEGENLSKPTFTLNSNGKSTLTLANQKTVGAIIAAEGAKNQINFAGGAAKSTQVNGDAGKEVIKIADDTKLTGKSVMNLGANKDKVIIDGIINKLTIDNGNDTAKDKIEISSLDNIQKRLKVKNFGEEDRLIIEGDAFRYQDLEDKDLREPLKDLGISVTLAEIN